MGHNYDLSAQKYLRTIRAHEYAEHQKVSLLDVKGLRKGGTRALWKNGITTAQQLLDTPVDDVVEKLANDLPGVSAAMVKGWHRQIASVAAERDDSRPEGAGEEATVKRRETGKNAGRSDDWYICQIAPREWLEPDEVSLLELRGLKGEKRASKQRIAALWKSNIRSTPQLEAANVDDLVAQLCQHAVFAAEDDTRRLVQDWQTDIRRLRDQRNPRGK